MNFVGEADNRMCEVIMFHRILREKKESSDRIYWILQDINLGMKIWRDSRVNPDLYVRPSCFIASSVRKRNLQTEFTGFYRILILRRSGRILPLFSCKSC